MDAVDIDIVNATLAVRLELQDLVASLPEIPSHAEVAQIRDRIGALLFQLEEVATFDAQQANVRVQQSIYRAMLSDFPEVERLLAQDMDSTDGDQDQQPPRTGGNSNVRVVGKNGYYEDPRIDSDGSTSLEAYMHDLEADEVHPPEECYVCLEVTPYSQLIRHEECLHGWCRSCLLQQFELVLKSESHYPVRCCRTRTAVSHQHPVIVRLLGEEAIARLEVKIKEYETEDRTYCYKPTCSAFIDPNTFKGDMATCPSCQRDTCVRCKAEFHSGSKCEDSQDVAFANWKEENEASACPTCHRVILISHGCNHMRCHCGTEFCYQCNARWKTCQCPLWNEARLLEQAEAIAVHQGRPTEVQRIMMAIANQEECRHDHFTRVRVHDDDDDCCSDCCWQADRFLWECDACDMRFCERCRRSYKH
ncbi:IBR domain-containing protein [Cladophialophora immunda]|nr:IBR domain-containing protein [Cladophialophora immunda]